MNAFAALCLLALVFAPGASLAAVPRWVPRLVSQPGALWVPPLDGPLVVRRAFAPPAVRWDAGHRGVDLAAYAGATVRSAGAGTVTFAGMLAGRGVLVVTHGTVRTTYEPVSPLASVGDEMSPGDVVGLLDTGHDGPAAFGEALLHWGLLRGDTYLDPLSLLNRGPSRLVPVAPADPPVLRLAAPPPAAAADLPTTGGTPAPAASGTDARAASGAVAGASLGALAALGIRRRISRAGRRASRATATRPSYASGRSGSRSRPAPGRSPPA